MGKLRYCVRSSDDGCPWGSVGQWLGGGQEEGLQNAWNLFFTQEEVFKPRYSPRDTYDLYTFLYVIYP